MQMKQEIIGIDNTGNNEIQTQSVPLGNAYAISIQATPGVEFYFNDQNNNKITMGPSGIYQLNFLEPILQTVNFTKLIDSLPIIIDYIQEDGNNG